MATNTYPIDVLITTPVAEDLLERLQTVSPRLQITMQPVTSPEEIPEERWFRTEVLYTDRVLPDAAQVPNLRWVQFQGQDISFLRQSSLIQKKNVVFTHSSGVAALKVAEYSVMMMLALGQQLRGLLDSQKQKLWLSEKENLGKSIRELRGSIVGIVGYGSIGREIARLLQPWQVTILATKRNAMNPADTEYVPDGLGDPEGDLFHRLYPVQALRSMVSVCDFVVVALPLTPATKNLLDEEILKVMKPSAFLLNVGDGGVVDEEALLKALQKGKIAGAGVDTFATEPLDSENPLWEQENLIITPHIAGLTHNHSERSLMLFMENFKRYIDGVTLYNYYDNQKEY